MDKIERNEALLCLKELGLGENIKHTKHEFTPSSNLNPTTSSRFQNARINQNFKMVSNVSLPPKSLSSTPKNAATISRSMSLNDGLNDISRTNVPLMKWTYLNGSSLSLPSHDTQPVSVSGSLLDHVDEENPQLHEPILPSTVKILPFGTQRKSDVCPIQNTAEVPSKKSPEKHISGHRESQPFSRDANTERFLTISNSTQETTDQINRKPIRSYSELSRTKIIINEFEARQVVKEIRVSAFEDQEKGDSNQSLNCIEEKEPNSDTQEPKDEKLQNNEDDFQATNLHDEMRINYVERPLLPLKPQQQQRSLSCTNLVQAIKGLSKRKPTLSSKLLSPENTLLQAKEISTSDANISNICKRKKPEESTEQKFENVKGDIHEFLTTKNVRQSLQYYTWYHMVDAKEARRRLLNMSQNGAFLIRPATNPSSEHFHTLCVLFYGEVYNFHIKNMKNGRIGLGKNYVTFTSLLSMIKYYQSEPVPITIGGQIGQVYLLITPSK